jgi:hypothetical protein
LSPVETIVSNVNTKSIGNNMAESDSGNLGSVDFSITASLADLDRQLDLAKQKVNAFYEDVNRRTINIGTGGGGGGGGGGVAASNERPDLGTIPGGPIANGPSFDPTLPDGRIANGPASEIFGDIDFTGGPVYAGGGGGGGGRGGGGGGRRGGGEPTESQEAALARLQLRADRYRAGSRQEEIDLISEHQSNYDPGTAEFLRSERDIAQVDSQLRKQLNKPPGGSISSKMEGWNPFSNERQFIRTALAGYGALGGIAAIEDSNNRGDREDRQAMFSTNAESVDRKLSDVRAQSTGVEGMIRRTVNSRLGSFISPLGTGIGSFFGLGASDDKADEISLEEQKRNLTANALTDVTRAGTLNLLDRQKEIGLAGIGLANQRSLDTDAIFTRQVADKEASLANSGAAGKTAIDALEANKTTFLAGSALTRSTDTGIATDTLNRAQTAQSGQLTAELRGDPSLSKAIGIVAQAEQSAVNLSRMYPDDPGPAARELGIGGQELGVLRRDLGESGDHDPDPRRFNYGSLRDRTSARIQEIDAESQKLKNFNPATGLHTQPGQVGSGASPAHPAHPAHHDPLHAKPIAPATHNTGDKNNPHGVSHEDSLHQHLADATMGPDGMYHLNYGGIQATLTPEEYKRYLERGLPAANSIPGKSGSDGTHLPGDANSRAALDAGHYLDEKFMEEHPNDPRSRAHMGEHGYLPRWESANQRWAVEAGKYRDEQYMEGHPGDPRYKSEMGRNGGVLPGYEHADERANLYGIDAQRKEADADRAAAINQNHQAKAQQPHTLNGFATAVATGIGAVFAASGLPGSGAMFHLSEETIEKLGKTIAAVFGDKLTN